jgi:hypothetical protein
MYLWLRSPPSQLFSPLPDKTLQKLEAALKAIPNETLYCCV